MFASLDKIDVVVKPGPDGRQQYFQTDHRAVEEVEHLPALSVLFALVRLLNPKRNAPAGTPEPSIIYAAQDRPPAFLRQAIRAAGAQLTVGSSFQPDPNEGEALPLEEILGSAFADLARSVAAEYEVDVTVEGLETVEHALASDAGTPDEDEFAYWSAVMKLGSFGGELIRASNGGQWRTTDSGSLPFALSTTFRGEQATVNPLGKAIKRIVNGEEDSLASLVNYIRSQA